MKIRAYSTPTTLASNNIEDKVEGYWRRGSDSSTSSYPLPIPNQLTGTQATEIHQLIKKKESVAEVIGYRGSSTSRIDGSRVGSREYRYQGWRWPEGFAEHYVLNHKVSPSKEFLKFIGYSDPEIGTSIKPYCENSVLSEDSWYNLAACKAVEELTKLEDALFMKRLKRFR